jgi:glycosyltransferase involved in cell wall biosynthesis
MPAGLATARVASILQRPYVLTLDSGELVGIDDIGYGLQRRWIDRHAVRAAIRSAATVTVPTKFMAQLMPVGTDPPNVIPVGVDRSLFPPANRTIGPPWRLIRVGSINRVKDYPTLLQACASVVQRQPDVHLDIVGEDRLDGGIIRLARRLGIDGRVTFHGSLDSRRVAELYARAHLNLVTSRHESANVTVLEAACTGLATVGTDVGYVSDLHPERAVAVPVNDPHALAAAILGLLHDSVRREELGRRAQEWALAHDADFTANAFEELYARVARNW